MQAVFTHANGTRTIFAIDSNARYITWHDLLTNKRGKGWRNFL
jgi:hypothetical protein